MVTIAALHQLACQDRSMLYLQLFLDPAQKQFQDKILSDGSKAKEEGLNQTRKKGKTIPLPQDLCLI